MYVIFFVLRNHTSYEPISKDVLLIVLLRMTLHHALTTVLELSLTLCLRGEALVWLGLVEAIKTFCNPSKHVPHHLHHWEFMLLPSFFHQLKFFFLPCSFRSSAACCCFLRAVKRKLPFGFFWCFSIFGRKGFSFD